MIIIKIILTLLLLYIIFIGLSSIGMHSPLALIHASTILFDMIDIQISFCKIVISIAKYDEIARENFIRFHIHKPLIKLILKQHIELSKLACITISQLCVKEDDIKYICENNYINHNNNTDNNNNITDNHHHHHHHKNNYTLIDSIIALLDAVPNDIKIQIEGVKVLVIIDNYNSDIILSIKKISYIQILKKSKKFLHHCIKTNQIPSDYDVKDIEILLNSPLWTKEKCIVS